jgi:hypothetical protein
MQKFIETITASANGTLVPLSSATVTVRLAGTGTLATLYSANNTSSPQTNPLTSSATGLVAFYAADGRYDITVSKAGFAPVTIGDVLLEDPADGIIKTISDATITASTMATSAITASTVNSTPIGATSASTGRFTSVQLAAGATGDIALGEMRLNSTESTIDVGLGGGVTGQMFEETFITVKNSTGSSLANGSVVSLAGANGSAPTVGLATANSAYQPLYTVGVLTQTIADGATGRATTFGKVRDLNTTGSAVGETWAAGDILYISPTTAGALTKVEPTAPNVAISVAAVLTVNATTGVLLVRPLLHARTHYGVFSSDTSQTADEVETAYAVEFTDTDVSSGVALDDEDGSLVIPTRAGLYNFQFSAQLAKSNPSVGYAWIWPRVNGTDIPNSATKVSVAGVNSEIVPSWNFVLPMDAGDEFQLMYAFSATSVSFDAVEAETFCPAIPSVILTVTQVNQ